MCGLMHIGVVNRDRRVQDGDRRSVQARGARLRRGVVRPRGSLETRGQIFVQKYYRMGLIFAWANYQIT